MSYKIKWSFINAKTATKAIDLLGATALDKINFYVNNKKIDSSRYKIGTIYRSSVDSDKKAKKEIRKFFKQNQGINDFVEFIKI